ncbi:MAG: hypothetical protein JJD92_01800 [Frankiaceae bacterium]|nr:hypothetical protein [Frankiaceae bacterium]
MPLHSPPYAGPAEWVLMCPAASVDDAHGMPPHMSVELVGLLEDRREPHADVLATQAAKLVRALVDGGARGSLRLVGTANTLLAEITEPPQSRNGHAETMDCFDPSFAGKRGQYYTYGERGSWHVAWAACPLPGRTSDVPEPIDSDVWT